MPLSYPVLSDVLTSRPLLFGLFLVLLCGLYSTALQARDRDGPAYCGDSGVWLQILGSGGPELLDERTSPSYLIWVDGKARMLVNLGPAASYNFNRSRGRIEDLEAVAFNNLQAQHAADLPGLLAGGLESERRERLPLLGPDGNDTLPGLSDMLERLIGEDGAFPQLEGFLRPASGTPFRLSLREVPATGSRRWAQFGSEHLMLSAIPVHHGDVPALAWRVEIDDISITFAGSFNNQKNLMHEFAKDTDALVVHHAINDNARGQLRDLHVTPSQIGRIASDANARMVILGHRSMRTRGVESLTRESIQEQFNGPIIFATDLQCWGL